MLICRNFICETLEMCLRITLHADDKFETQDELDQAIWAEIPLDFNQTWSKNPDARIKSWRREDDEKTRYWFSMKNSDKPSGKDDDNQSRETEKRLSKMCEQVEVQVCQIHYFDVSQK